MYCPGFNRNCRHLVLIYRTLHFCKFFNVNYIAYIKQHLFSASVSQCAQLLVQIQIPDGLSSEVKMADIVERPLQTSSIPILSRQVLCWDFLDGFCKKGDTCKFDHTLCMVECTTPPENAPPTLLVELNRLSPEPRAVPKRDKFENDGPAHISGLGPRHNNDHVDVRAVSFVLNRLVLTRLSFRFVTSRFFRLQMNYCQGDVRICRSRTL